MKADVNLLACCGFYCGDCLRYTGVIADPAHNLIRVLEKYSFGRTAECVFPRELSGYGDLCEMLGFMATLRCPGICRTPELGDRPSPCEVRDCCREKGFYACYQCDEFETCEVLLRLHEGLHAEACAVNMRAIREMGLTAWLDHGERHCYWTEAGEAE